MEEYAGTSGVNLSRLSPAASGHHGAIGPIPLKSEIYSPDKSRVARNGAFSKSAAGLCATI